MAITPRFSGETDATILTRLLNAIDDSIDKRQGSVAYDLTAPTAMELAQAYVKLDNTLSYAFLNENMPSELLTIAASDLGVDRKPSVKAVGNVVIGGPVTQFVPKGTQFRTDNGIYFATTADATLTGGTAVVAVEAVIGGTSGNVGIGEINTVVGDLVGIITVTNNVTFDSGINEESDEALLQRVYDKLRKPATSGNVYHYEQWANEVNGVSDAKVYPVWNGPGTVKVVILGDDKKSPTQAVVDAASAHINAECPIGANVTVVGATEFAINVTVTLTLTSVASIEVAQQEITDSITAYLKTIAFTDSVVRYTQIANAILNSESVIDYSNLTINGGTANIETTDEQIAVIGTVVVNAV